MRVLFIEPPPTLEWLPGSSVSTAGRRHPSLNFTGEQVYSYINLSAAAVLRRAGHEVTYWHCQTHGIPVAAMRERLTAARPELVVIVAEHVNLDVTAAIIRLVHQESDAAVVLVGPLATALDADIMERLGSDFVLRREWDLAVAHLAGALDERRPLAAVAGLTWRRDGAIVRNPDGALIENLDDLPFPAFDLVDLRRFYESVFKRFPAATTITSRGCPFHCVYCAFPETIYDHVHRAQSPERVLEEARYLRRDFGVREIRYDDDTFEIDRDRVFRICEKFQQARLGLIWAPQSRPGNIDPDLARAMRRAGCTFILYGVESGDDDILRRIRKGTTTDQIRRGVRAAKDAGIDVLNCVMLGFYWDTPETVRQTIAFAFELNAEFTQFSMPVPLPGTAYWQLLVAEGVVSPDDWFRSDSFHGLCFDLPHLKGEDINRILRETYSRYYTRPGYQLMMAVRALRSWDNFRQSWRGLGALLVRRRT